MLELIKTAGTGVPTAAAGKVVLFVNSTGALTTKDEAGAEAPITGGSSSNTFSTIAVSGQSSVVADTTTDTLTLVAGTNATITTNAATDTITIDAVPTFGFGNVAVSGQPTVSADSALDTLTLVAGTNISMTSNATSDSITINASVPASNSFTTIAVSGQSDVVADAATDTLTLVAGANITLTTNAASDTITIASTGGGAAALPTWTADVITSRTIITSDLQNVIVFNSASNQNFTVPNDATLAITGSTNNTISIYHKGNGVASFVAGSGVTITPTAGAITPTLGVTSTLHRVGASTWAYL